MPDLSSFITTPGIPYVWRLLLQGASWRGISFSVQASEIKRGRRTAIHEYPYATGNATFVEDLGLGTRVVSMQGFIVGDFVTLKWRAMLAAFEKAGSGTLVHPSLGSMNVSCIEYSAREIAEANRVVEFRATFIEVPMPANAPVKNTTSDGQASRDNLDTASSSDFSAGLAALPGLALAGIGLAGALGGASGGSSGGNSGGGNTGANSTSNGTNTTSNSTTITMPTASMAPMWANVATLNINTGLPVGSFAYAVNGRKSSEYNLTFTGRQALSTTIGSGVPVFYGYPDSASIANNAPTWISISDELPVIA